MDVADASNLCLSPNTPSASPVIRRLVGDPMYQSQLDHPSTALFKSMIVSGGLHSTATKADISFSIRTPLSGEHELILLIHLLYFFIYSFIVVFAFYTSLFINIFLFRFSLFLSINDKLIFQLFHYLRFSISISLFCLFYTFALYCVFFYLITIPHSCYF